MVEQLAKIVKREDPGLDADLSTRFSNFNTRESIETIFEECRKRPSVWEDFERWLWDDCKISDISPTEAHRSLARLATQTTCPVRFIEFNFDGLMKKALTDAVVKSDTKAAIYTNVDGVSTWFARAEKTLPVFEMRGDVLYGTCSNEGCEGHKSPKYLLDGLERMCDKCGSLTELHVILPGNAEKFRQNDEILRKLDSYVFPHCRTILIVGFSGNWDDAFVNLLYAMVRRQELTVIELNLGPSEFTSIASVSMIGKMADEVLPELVTRTLERAKSILSEASNPTLALGPSGHQIPPFDGDIPLTELERLATRAQPFDRMLRVLQLSLKSTPLGVAHTRHEHSLGVMQLADQFYQALPLEHNPRERQFLRLAALFHDIGHVPMSHLMEEVFEELNWKPGGSFESFKHDYHTEAVLNSRELEAFRLEFESNLSPFSIQDLVVASRGQLGVPYLDAIISSPMDADKADYVQRDLHHIRKAGSIEFDSTLRLQELLQGLRESRIQHGFPVLSTRAANEVLRVLETRFRLYERVYLSPSSRWVEASAKQLMLPFFLKLAFTPSFADVVPLGEFTTAKVTNVLDELHRSYGDDQHRIVTASTEYLRESLTEAKDWLSGVERAQQATRLGPAQPSPSPLLELRLKQADMRGDPEAAFKAAMNERRECLLEHPWTLVVDLFKFPEFAAQGFGTMGAREAIYVRDHSEPLPFSEWVANKKTPDIVDLESSLTLRCYALTNDPVAANTAVRSLQTALMETGYPWKGL